LGSCQLDDFAMRPTHEPDATGRVERSGKWDDLPGVLHSEKECTLMFVRAVWRQQRLVDVRPTLREMGAPPKRNTDIFGHSRPDFPQMTRGLFDRQP
jgi:hypothetical protein